MIPKSSSSIVVSKLTNASAYSCLVAAINRIGVRDTHHHHGRPACVTVQLDAVDGPSHLIGVAADGFPIYGSKNINGNTVTIDQLDACGVITRPTPDVLPEGLPSFQSSLRYYSGTITK